MSKVEFSFSSIENFDDHICSSIIGYNTLFKNVIKISEYFIRSDSTVIDIGCSTGKCLTNIEDHNKICDVLYVGIEVEENFYKDLDKIHKNNVTFFKDDVLNYTLPNNASYIISMFTLQFIQKRYRHTIIQNIYDSLIEGGAFVISEKVLSEESKFQDMMTSLYYEDKQENFSHEEILSKEKDLRSMMSLDKESKLVESLIEVGFDVQCFWRNYNFVGYVCIK